MTRQPRVYYVGMITTDAYGRAVGERTYSGAGARKMMLVTRALRGVGHRAMIVSLPFVGTGASRLGFGSVVISDGGVPAVFLATLRSKYLRKLIGPLILAGFAARRICRHDSVILYNHAVEYLPALVVLRLKGIKPVHDIEDAPADNEAGLRGLLNRVSFAITSRLTRRRKMVVAEHVAKRLGLDDYVTIRGVASQEIVTGPFPDLGKWNELRLGGALKLHFGGSLITETGVDLFCDAVDLLTRNADRLARPVSFVVTGIGDIDKIRNLQTRIGSDTKVDVELLPELSNADYVAVIEASHGSLSLKRPGSAMSNTTFPSKVIEITAAGLALVSTRIGDVPEIFAGDTVYFLAGYRPEDLVQIVIEMVSNPERVERVAAAGRDLCNAVFAPKVVGEELKRLL